MSDSASITYQGWRGHWIFYHTSHQRFIIIFYFICWLKNFAIGKIKQKYQKSKTNPTRSKSDANIAASSQRYLKRRGSERHGKGAEARSRKVAFEDQREVPWWNFPMRLMKNSDVSKSTGNLLKKKRTRHSTDPESSKDQGYCPAKQNNIFRHILLLI